MKIYGGYSPKIAGKPSSDVRTVPLSNELRVELLRHGVEYNALVQDGDTVALGAPLAESPMPGGMLCLPAPAAGVVSLQKAAEGKGPATIVIRTAGEKTGAGAARFEPPRTDGKALRAALARGGVWPLLWSSTTSGIPSLDEVPRSIIVTSVLAEPFRTEGAVVLGHWRERIDRALPFLPRLLSDKGTIEIVLGNSTAAWQDRLTGNDRMRFHSVPLRYPVENPRILYRALRKADPSIGREDPVWVIDLQGLAALGSCLADGIPLCERLVALGGPGLPAPTHVSVRIGTPISALGLDGAERGPVRVLRGGLFTGVPVDPAAAAVQYDDDTFFFLPERPDRELLAFLNPGFDRTSALSCFVSEITGALDRNISTNLRGERRPCIACGICEDSCPARLMPQMLHRLLYRGGLEEAEAIGLDLCVACGLCTFVCPSKIELHTQFAETKEQIRKEQEELRQMEARQTKASSR